jgi:hypothetical protein
MLITEEMYLLAKTIVNSYNEQNIITKDYSYKDMKECFSGGINNGCYIASKIQGNPIVKFDGFDDFMKNKYETIK